jgi:hypothetical protein
MAEKKIVSDIFDTKQEHAEGAAGGAQRKIRRCQDGSVWRDVRIARADILFSNLSAVPERIYLKEDEKSQRDHRKADAMVSWTARAGQDAAWGTDFG